MEPMIVVEWEDVRHEASRWSTRTWDVPVTVRRRMYAADRRDLAERTARRWARDADGTGSSWRIVLDGRTFARP